MSLLLVLAACSGEQGIGGTQSTQGPDVQLFLLVNNEPVVVSESSVVGMNPVFEVRVSDRQVVTNVEYNINGGAWQRLTLNQLARAQFTPANPVSGSSATINVRGTNAAGGVTTVTSQLSVDSVPPRITAFELDTTDYLTGTIPDFGLIHGQSGSIHIYAQADDGPGRTAGVQIVVEQDAEVITASSAGMLDYSINTSALEVGVSRYRVYAIDGVGNRSQEFRFAVRVGTIESEQPPTLAIVSPADGVSLPVGSDIRVLVDVAAGSSGVRDVVVSLGGVVLTTADNHVFTGNAPAEPGLYVLSAYATSAGPLALRSQTVVQTVNVSAEAPAVEVLSPTVTDRIVTGQEFLINLKLTDAGGGLGDLNVTFANSAPLVRNADGTYSATAPAAAGTYALRVTAQDASGANSTVVSQDVVVIAPGAPSVTVVNLAGDLVILPGQAFPVSLQVEDQGGGVGDVEVYFDGALQAPSGAGGYHYSLTAPAAAGDYDLEVRAWNVLGTLSTDVHRRITVTPFEAPVVRVLSPQSDRTLAAGGDISVLLDVQPRNGGLGEIFVTFNGDPLTVSATNPRLFEGTVPADLPTDTYEISAWAETGTSPAESSDVYIQKIAVASDAPLLNIVNPVENRELRLGTGFTVTLSVSDAGGGIDPASVVISFNDIDYPVTGITGPGFYQVSIPDSAVTDIDELEIIANATSLSGNASAPATVSVRVIDDTPLPAPEVAISTPDDGHVFTADQEIRVTLDIIEFEGGIGDVHVVIGFEGIDTPMTQIDDRTFSYMVQPTDETASYEIRAWAFSDGASHGGPVQSNVAYTRIYIDNTPPVVSIINPIYRQVVDGPNFGVSVQANDYGSEIVEILVVAQETDATFTSAVGAPIEVGVITDDLNVNSPIDFQANLPGDAALTYYLLTATAKDLVGNESVSIPVPVTVPEWSPPTP